MSYTKNKNALGLLYTNILNLT